MKFILIAAIVILTPLSLVRAGSTSVFPAKFSLNGETSKIISKTITVSNLSNATQQYSLYPEEGNVSAKRVSVVPERFILEPQESITAVVRFRPASDSWHTNLNLVAYQASQLQSNFRVGEGIKIPVIFIPGQVAGAFMAKPESSSNLWTWNILVFGIDFILFFIVCYWYYQRHFWWRQRINHKINFL